MKNWQIALLFLACFGVVGLVDRPEYYNFEYKNMPPVNHEHKPIKQAVEPVENLLKTPVELVNYPSPTIWR